jgi:hypothetical protein
VIKLSLYQFSQIASKGIKRFFMFLSSVLSIAISVGSINDYPYLKKDVPRPERKELDITPKLKERDFIDRADDYSKCLKAGNNERNCRDLLGPSYELELEIKPH